MCITNARFFGGNYLNITKALKNLTKFEITLWISSVVIVTISFFLSQKFNPLTLVASLTGSTALIFVAKGNVIGQILTIIFSILYAIISFQFCYYGEMITYLGMTAPIALMSVVSWLRHPYKDTAEVTVNRLSRIQKITLIVLTIVVTSIFYFILKAFDTPNLFLSTVSIATSFSASYLMLFRSPAYALAYAGNDVVLIILWILASLSNPSFIPVIICFCIFFINDIYGFFNWQKMKKNQKVNLHHQ